MLKSEEKILLKAKSISKVNTFNPGLKLFILGFINSIGKTLFFFKKNIAPKEVKKILFISLYFNGDILFQSPLFETVRKIYPESELHIWTKKRAQGAIEGYPYFKKNHIFDEIRTRRFDEDVKFDLLKKIYFFKTLKKENYDVIFDVTGLFWTAFAVFYSKPKYSVGFNYQGFDFIYNFASQAVTNGHLIERHLNLITNNIVFSKFYNDSAINHQPKFYIPAASKDTIDKILLSLNINEYFKKIVIHTTAGWDSKKWDLNNFITLIQKLPAEYAVILIGGKIDIENADLIKKNVCRKIFNFTGRFSLTETAEVIRRSDIYVGADSGPLYIAQTVGIKTISLFGPTNPIFSAPIGSTHKYIYHELFCSAPKDEQNCKLIAGLNCRTIDCMKLIKPDEVLKLLLENN